MSFPQKFVDRVACTMAFWTMECTLKHEKYTYRKRQRFHLHLLLIQQTNDHFSSFFVCKAKILVSRTLSTRHFYCLRFSLFCFRLNWSIRKKTGTHVFWENGVDSLRAQPRSQGLLGFQYGGGSWEDPGTQWTKKIADWCFSHVNSDWFNVERKMAASEESQKKNRIRV